MTTARTFPFDQAFRQGRAVIHCERGPGSRACDCSRCLKGIAKGESVEIGWFNIGDSREQRRYICRACLRALETTEETI